MCIYIDRYDVGAERAVDARARSIAQRDKGHGRAAVKMGGGSSYCRYVGI